MGFKLRCEDGRVHFSIARHMATSAAYAREMCERPPTSTAAMQFGTLVDIVLMPAGRNLAVFPGKIRRGEEWDRFRAANIGAVIAKKDEIEEASRCAERVATDPDVARMGLLSGRHQHPFQWDMHGLPWATRGLDVLGDGFVNDLKTTSSTELTALSHHIRKMRYPEQLATYRCAARAFGHRIDHCYLTCVESRPPWDVVVIEIEEEDLAEAETEVELWCARIRRAEESGEWGKRSPGVMRMRPKSPWEAGDANED